MDNSKEERGLDIVDEEKELLKIDLEKLEEFQEVVAGENRQEFENFGTPRSTSTLGEEDKRTENDVSSLSETAVSPRRYTPRAEKMVENMMEWCLQEDMENIAQGPFINCMASKELKSDAEKIVKEKRAEKITEGVLKGLLQDAVSDVFQVINAKKSVVDNGIISGEELKKIQEKDKERSLNVSPRSSHSSGGSPRSPLAEKYMAIFREPHPHKEDSTKEISDHSHERLLITTSTDQSVTRLELDKLLEEPAEDQWMDDDFGLSHAHGSPLASPHNKENLQLQDTPIKSPKSPKKKLDLDKFTTDVFSAVPCGVEEVRKLIQESVDKLWQQTRCGELISAARVPASLFVVGPATPRLPRAHL